jgi:hypothetical protein
MTCSPVLQAKGWLNWGGYQGYRLPTCFNLRFPYQKNDNFGKISPFVT